VVESETKEIGEELNISKFECNLVSIIILKLEEFGKSLKEIPVLEDLDIFYQDEQPNFTLGSSQGKTNSSWVVILMDMSTLKQIGMMVHMEVSVMGKETVKGCQFWTLRLPMI